MKKLLDRLRGLQGPPSDHMTRFRLVYIGLILTGNKFSISTFPKCLIARNGSKILDACSQSPENRTCFYRPVEHFAK